MNTLGTTCNYTKQVQKSSLLHSHLKALCMHYVHAQIVVIPLIAMHVAHGLLSIAEEVGHDHA